MICPLQRAVGGLQLAVQILVCVTHCVSPPLSPSVTILTSRLVFARYRIVRNSWSVHALAPLCFPRRSLTCALLVCAFFLSLRRCAAGTPIGGKFHPLFVLPPSLSAVLILFRSLCVTRACSIEGYIYLETGGNTCGLGDVVTYANVPKKAVRLVC